MRRTALLLSATIAVLVWLLAGCARYDLGQEALQEEPLGEATNGKIAFQTSGAIWAMNANGSDPRLLTKTVPDPGWSISPDGEKIAFAAERTEVDCGNNRGDCPEETTAQIYVMNADGSDKTKLLEDMGGSPPPDWSPDSKKIAFGLSDADARRCALYAMNANGWGDPIPLTNFDGCYSIESLAWSPNGKKIAVEILEEGNGYDNDIYVLDVPAEGRTSQPRQLTNGPHTWWNIDPTWSPDSTEIAYTHMNTAVFENQWSIYKMNADGSGKTRLAAGQVYYEPPNNPPPGPVAMDSPAWSPDGEKIAFVRGLPDESPAISSAIYVMKSDGSDDPTLIRRLQAEAVSNLEWLPHHVDLPLATSTTSAPGQQHEERTVSEKPARPTEDCTPGEDSNREIAFHVDGHVWTMNADGSDPARLTHNQSHEDTPAWSPDGKKIAFMREVGVQKIVVTDADGCNQIELPVPEGKSAYEPTWSADGKRIAFWHPADCGIYVTNADGSDTPKSLPTPSLSGCDARPEWSPDGSQLAFQSVGQDGWADIYIVEVSPEGEASQPRRLTDHPLQDAEPSWSPDGTEIAFTTNRTGPESMQDIYKINVNSLKETRLTSSPNSEHSPTWSPDGDIAFARDNTATSASAIYVMRSDGSDPTLLRNFPLGGDEGEYDGRTIHLDWRPQPGRVGLPLTTPAADAPSQKQQKAEHPIGKITFSSDRDGDNEIFKMGSDGTAVTQLTNNTAGNDLSPAWSPDGSKIAFVSSLAGNFDIHVMNADGSNSKQLTASPDNEWAPAWSPDGSKIAFERELPAGEGQVLPKIFLMDAHGSNQVQLRTETTFSEESPDWSPDGSKIVFVGVGGIAGGSHIYTMNVDGTGLTQLTENNFYTKASPDWSPDGSKILFGAYDSRAGGKYDVFVMNADGSGVQNLTNQPNSHDIQAVWSPDGREIALVRDQNGDCASTQDGTCEIWRMRSDGSPPTRVTSDTANDHDPDWKPIPQ